ncbi:zinc finger protein 346-like isoform X1 [Clytia hemisphaerica]|uniref:C2H2-type domain-containing protein n=1 Tax=Clytia hemisphaerica TaxID=252671 RepID=A0A7M5WK01_9CNID
MVDVIYPDNTPISSLTNRPYKGQIPKTWPNFVCSECNMALHTPIVAIQHFNGRCIKSNKKHVKRDLSKTSTPTQQFNIEQNKTHQTTIKSKNIDDSNLDCKVCNAALNGPSSAKEHYAGKKHAMAVQAILDEGGHVPDVPPEVKSIPYDKSEFHCDVCNINLTSQAQYEQHIGGTKHKMIADGAQPSDFSNYKGKQTPSKMDPPPSKPPPSSLHCNDCNMTMNSEDQYVQHMNSKRHRENTGLPVPPRPKQKVTHPIPVPESLHCNDCNMTMNSEDQYVQHMNSKRHRENTSGGNYNPNQNRGIKRPAPGSDRGSGRGGGGRGAPRGLSRGATGGFSRGRGATRGGFQGSDRGVPRGRGRGQSHNTGRGAGRGRGRGSNRGSPSISRGGGGSQSAEWWRDDGPTPAKMQKENDTNFSEISNPKPWIRGGFNNLRGGRRGGPPSRGGGVINRLQSMAS